MCSNIEIYDEVAIVVRVSTVMVQALMICHLREVNERIVWRKVIQRVCRSWLGILSLQNPEVVLGPSRTISQCR